MRFRSLMFAMLTVGSLPPAPAKAQVVVDEGSFTISRGGQPVGREEFTIRSTPSGGGALYVARATARYGERKLTPLLNADPSGRPLRYSIDVRDGKASELSVSAHSMRGRFVSRVRNATGESEREYVVGDGAVLIDDDVWHHYYFLARATRNGEIAVVVPQKGAQQQWRVSTQATETVMIGGRERPAVRLLVSPDGAPDRQVWVDPASSKVLRVAVPASGLVATRDDPPK